MSKYIGLLADIEDSKFHFNRKYWEWARRFSNNVQLISPLDKHVEDFDLLILPGGADVLPFRYGEYLNNNLCLPPNFRFEEFDCAMLPLYIKQGTPIFGICRGMQTLNVHFQGTLHQHIWGEPNSTRSRGELVQDMRTSKSILKINSLHHQAVKDLGEGLIPYGYASVVDKKKGRIDRHVEAFKHEALPIAAVQFHPEELFSNKEADETTKWVDKLVHGIMR